MSSLSGGKLMPASSSTSNSSSPLISLTLAAYSAGSLLLEEGGDHDDQGIGNLNLTYGVVPFSSSSLSSTAVQHLLPSQQVNASTNALIESITASPSTDNSTAAAGPANIFTTLKIVKISLLAVIFVLILCGNVFVLLALNSSQFMRPKLCHALFIAMKMRIEKIAKKLSGRQGN
ncbi:hypothetical protein TYRP_018566 [Tyrophagus putrescentiae]|nr:hypothetical protein TYRP_018566 [Tyrophagus putrescentiae]